jgi:hypothetical protein
MFATGAMQDFVLLSSTHIVILLMSWLDFHLQYFSYEIRVVDASEDYEWRVYKYALTYLHLVFY